ncbi:MAG: efflux RND transporter periplasmic adaptor subunit [Holophagae bacterium]|jgi:RND family efflux transporter MFP subunit
MRPKDIFPTSVGLIILCVAVALTAWPESAHETPAAEPDPRAVRVEAVSEGKATDQIRLAGHTRAARRAKLGFSLAARLAHRPVEVGDQVRQGQILAALDDREATIAARAAEAAVAELAIRAAQAERDLDRVQRLVDARAATTEELERTAATSAALRAALDAAGARLDDTRRLVDESVLRAPFAGTITAVNVEPGEWAAPGRSVVEVAGDGAVEVIVEAPETVCQRILDGQPVTVELPFLGVTTTGRVSDVAAAASGPGALFPVIVTVDTTEAVVAGLTANVVIGVSSGPELTVPMRAVINPGSSTPSVFRIANGVAHEVQVELGRVRGDRIAVVARLEVDDEVAVTGHTSLRSGDRVEVHR